MLLALALAPAAHAAGGQESILQDDNLLLYRGDAASTRTLTEAAALGFDRVRLSVHWRSIAPAQRAGLTGPATDPASYEAAAFDKFDHVVREGRRLGVGVLFNVTGPAPTWASGRRAGRRVNGQFKPSARGFGQFVEMLGRRYSGSYPDEHKEGILPRVGHWSVWNEPNQGAFLQPQWERDRNGAFVPASPRIYRGLVRAMTAGLARSGHGRDVVLLGETAPLGAVRKGRTRAMAPGRFLTELLCLDRRTYRPLRPPALRRKRCDFGERGALAVNAYGHHPYPVMQPPGRRRGDPEEFSLADRDELARLLDAALAAGRVPTGLALWFTEFGWQTRPPDPYRGIPLDRHALWIAQAEHIMRGDPRVAATSNFLLRDDDPWMRFPATDRRRWTTYQTGLRFDDGRPKPALEAFRLPLVRTGPRSVWGLVRPATGPTSVQLEFASAGSDAFQPLGDALTTDGHGQFSLAVTTPGPGRLRFRWVPPPAPEPPPPGLLEQPRPSPPPPSPLHSPAILVR